MKHFISTSSLKLRGRIVLILGLIFLLFFHLSRGQAPVQPVNKYNSYKGLIMVGYQGWLNAEGDGAGRGWNHFAKDNLFAPGSCVIDFWPETAEYPQKYKTSFVHANGEPAYVFSSYDESTVQLHFEWMKKYHIDGAFVQRFVTLLKDPKGRLHTNKVLKSAVRAAKQQDRALAVLYDLSGMQPEDYQLVINDWKQLVDTYHFNQKAIYPNYLFHRNKPLVAVWGIGFNDGRKYGLKEAEKIINFLKNDPKYGTSVIAGVPAFWRDLNNDAQNDPRLHTILKKADIVHPWFVGRYNEEAYPIFQGRIAADLAWCKQNKLDYVPTVFPGFSWHNLQSKDSSNAIARNQGRFLWKQLAGAIETQASMIYVAMFDEVDEETAIFKCTQDVPVGASRFVPYEKEIPTDHYMWLVGQAAAMLRKEISFQKEMPQRTD